VHVGIVGLGYVGLPLAVAFAEAGVQVTGFDIDAARVRDIGAGRSHVGDIPDDRLGSTLERLAATTDPSTLAVPDAVLICVPTPLTPEREPDLGPLLAAGRIVAEHLRDGQLVVLESTTYPGTTRDLVQPLLEAGGLRVGTDIHLAFSPERVDPGRTDHTLRSTPKLVAGLSPACSEVARRLYDLVCDHVVVLSSPETAELAKLLENVFRSVNIALVNELALLCDRMGIDVWEVVDAASTKPYGFMRFEPGPGMGGHCIPVDPFYLSWRARGFDMTTEFIELAGKVNQQMPHHAVERIQRSLNDIGLAVRGARIALLGVAYKPGTSDTRESPALKIIPLLRDLGADLRYHDPLVPSVVGLESSDYPGVLDGVDLAVIVTAQPEIDAETVVTRASRVLDLRGVTAGMHHDHVERL
jgi:UDP-N-acetyl-D-glucosamine dehydrogenase